jgi:hypothetical protein
MDPPPGAYDVLNIFPKKKEKFKISEEKTEFMQVNALHPLMNGHFVL